MDIQDLKVETRRSAVISGVVEDPKTERDWKKGIRPTVNIWLKNGSDKRLVGQVAFNQADCEGGGSGKLGFKFLVADAPEKFEVAAEAG